MDCWNISTKAHTKKTIQSILENKKGLFHFALLHQQIR